MRTLLTDTLLARKRVDQRVEVYDSLIPGFGVLMLPTGARTFFVRYRWRGKQPRRSLGRYPQTTLEAAREKAAETLRMVERGVDPAKADRTPARKRRTVEAFAKDYLRLYARPNKRTWKEDERRIQKLILPAWGDAAPEEIERRDVIALTDRIAETAPYEANRVRALISRMWSWGIARSEVDVNPAAGTMAPGVERPRESVLTPEEIATCWQALAAENSPAARAYRIFLLTGAREIAVYGLAEQEVEGLWATIPAERMKGARPWRLYLTPLVRESVGEPKRGFYFLSPRRKKGKWLPISSTSTALRRLKDRTGLEHFGHRTMRRTVATGMGALGVQPHIIDEILAHAPATVGRRHYNMYAYDAEKRDAWLAWERRVREIVGLSEQPRVVVPIR